MLLLLRTRSVLSTVFLKFAPSQEATFADVMRVRTIGEVSKQLNGKLGWTVVATGENVEISNAIC